MNILSDFLRNRKQRVRLWDQSFSWVNVKAGVPQVFILGPLLFLIYINDLSDGLSSDAKLFTDYTSLFSVVNEKQAQEIIFSRKLKTATHPPFFFIDSNVS